MAQDNHLFDCYNPPAITFERGEGAYLYTDKDERYLDFIAGIAVNALGHAPKAVGDAVKAQMDKVWHLSNLYRKAACAPYRLNVCAACAPCATNMASC